MSRIGIDLPQCRHVVYFVRPRPEYPPSSHSESASASVPESLELTTTATSSHKSGIGLTDPISALQPLGCFPMPDVQKQHDSRSGQEHEEGS